LISVIVLQRRLTSDVASYAVELISNSGKRPVNA